jgi:hypothetical protein
MKKNISTEEARLFLQNVPEENVFWVQDGRVLKNLDELHMALSEMNEDTFKHHVNEERNDFHNWIRDIIKDEQLAEEIKKAKTPKIAHKTVKHRVMKLKKHAKV